MDDDDFRRRVGWAVGLLVALTPIGLWWYLVFTEFGQDDARAIVLDSPPPTSTSSTEGASTEPIAMTEPTDTEPVPTTEPVLTTEPVPTSEPLEATTASTTTAMATTSTTVPPTTTTVAPTTTSIAPTTTVAPVGPAVATLPDGRPVSALVVLDIEQTTLIGTVGSEADAIQLNLFATSYRSSASTVVNRLTIDPDTPESAGVWIVDRTSVQFTDESDDVTSEHAQQLDRMAAVMGVSPRLRLHVIGNAHIDNDEAGNLAVSQRCANAVVNYLVEHGVDLTRLTMQPAGESIPIGTEPTDELVAAPGRRTDFVVYGLLDG